MKNIFYRKSCIGSWVDVTYKCLENPSNQAGWVGSVIRQLLNPLKGPSSYLLIFILTRYNCMTTSTPLQTKISSGSPCDMKL